MYDIVNCLNTDQKEILENRLIFINWDSKIDGIIEENRIIGFKDNSSISIKVLELVISRLFTMN